MGHKVSHRKLHKAIAPVREQLVLNTFEPEESNSFNLFGFLAEKNKVKVKTETICFAVRIFPEYYLDKFIRNDIEDSLEKMCNWMVCSQDPETLWRLDFLKYRRNASSQLVNTSSLETMEETCDCWAKITNSWEIGLIEDIHAGVKTTLPPCGQMPMKR